MCQVGVSLFCSPENVVFSMGSGFLFCQMMHVVIAGLRNLRSFFGQIWEKQVRKGLVRVIQTPVFVKI